jgi:capsular polysaccharide biosynthesis protein
MIKGAEMNYWHFLSDMLGVVVLIDKYNLPKNIPLIVPQKLADQKFFKQVIAYSPELQSRNWVIQDDTYILADKVFFCQKMPNQKDQLEGLLNLLNIKDADKNSSRKIYVRRSPSRIRFINNDEEIQKIAIKCGFEVVDCDNLNFAQQVALFSESSHVIGIHGAGLTNIIWRKNAPSTLLELFPEDYIHPGYFWAAKSFGKDYLALSGGPILSDTSFYINPENFEKKIVEMLDDKN